MPKLPQAIDYGARPSLHSGRVDMPGTGDLATGAALATAAGTFAQLHGQQKAREDRLNYSLAKNELLTADITAREGLKDSQEWDTHDQTYTDTYTAAQDEILARYGLGPADRSLLGAQSDLIRERGRVQVGSDVRAGKLLQQRATIGENLIIAREQVLNETPKIANEIMLTQLENIEAAVAEGVYTPTEGLGLSQKFVADTAVARLDTMDAEPRIKELELTLAKRTAHGAISIEDIRAGKGSDSIADFVPRDVAQDMLDKAKEENKISNIQGVVHGLIDEMGELYQLTDANSLSLRKREGRKRLKAQYGDDPNYGSMRDSYESQQSQRNNEDRGIDELARSEIDRTLSKLLDEGVNYHQLPAGAMKLLSKEDKAGLRRYAEQVQSNEGFAVATNPDMAYAWNHFTPTQMVNTNINGTEWRSQFSRTDWNRMIEVQQAYKNSKGKDPNIFSGDSPDQVLKNMIVGRGKLYDRVPKPGDTEYERYLRIDTEVNNALTDASLVQFVETGSGKLLPQQIREITAQTIGQIVYVDVFWGGGDPRHMAGLSQGEKDSGKVYVHINELRSIDAEVDSQGNPQNMEQFIRNFAGTGGEKLSDRKIEKAYYLWITGDTAGAEALLTE